MLEHALGYLALGWSIIPIHSIRKGVCTCGDVNCPKPGKHPRLKEWRDYIEERPTKKQLEKWFTKWPNSNIAVITGYVSDLGVLDVDDLAQYKEIKANDPTARIARTGSNGRHLFYSYPDDGKSLPNTVQKLAPKVDSRADGGYIILPPSRHISGSDYEWIKSGELGELSTSTLRTLRGEGKNSKKAQVKEKAEFWIDEVLENGVTEGSRNDTVAKLAGFYAGKGMPLDIAITSLSTWNEAKNDPALPHKELLTTIKSVYRKESRKPVEKPRKLKIEDDIDTDELLEHVHINDLLVEYGDKPVNWVIPGWLPEKTIQMVIAPPETRKTWLLFDLAVSIASGKPFLGMYPVNPTAVGPVLIIQQEDYLGDQAARLSVIINNKTMKNREINCTSKDIELQLPPNLPIYVHKEATLKIDDDEQMQRLENLISKLKIKQVIIDPFYTIASLNNYGADAIEHLMRFKELRNKYGCGFTIAHHTSKQGKNNDKGSISTNREDSWGSQLLNGWLETGWQVRKTDNANVILVRAHFKTARSHTQHTLLEFDIETDSFPSKYVIKEVEDKKDEVEEEAVDIINILKRNGALTKSEIVKFASVKVELINKALKPLEETGTINRDRMGRYSISKKIKF